MKNKFKIGDLVRVAMKDNRYYGKTGIVERAFIGGEMNEPVAFFRVSNGETHTLYEWKLELVEKAAKIIEPYPLVKFLESIERK